MDIRVTPLSRERVERDLDGVIPWGDTCMVETHHFAHSVAVSTKRAAEALERIAEALQPSTAPDAAFLSILENMGRQ